MYDPYESFFGQEPPPEIWGSYQGRQFAVNRRAAQMVSTQAMQAERRIKQAIGGGCEGYQWLLKIKYLFGAMPP